MRSKALSKLHSSFPLTWRFNTPSASNNIMIDRSRRLLHMMDWIRADDCKDKNKPPEAAVSLMIKERLSRSDSGLTGSPPAKFYAMQKVQINMEQSDDVPLKLNRLSLAVVPAWSTPSTFSPCIRIYKLDNAHETKNKDRIWTPKKRGQKIPQRSPLLSIAHSWMWYAESADCHKNG